MNSFAIDHSLKDGGLVSLSGSHYRVEEHFAHSILFLRIEAEGEQHCANLFLKTGHALLRERAEGMLHEQVRIEVPASLFRQVDRFQASRRSLEGNRYGSGGAGNAAEWEDQLSQEIYDRFFAGDIGEVVRNFVGALEARKISELLLVISSPDERVRNLPWEMVLDRLVPEKGGVLPLQGFGLVRTTEQDLHSFDMRGVPVEAAPLKMLFVTALPEDLPERSKNLQLEDEQRRLIEAVGALEATGDSRPKMVIEFLDVASLAEIKRALQERHHDVLHISGHGKFHEEIEQGILYLENEEGDTAKTEGAALAAELRGLGHVKLLVLSACETAIAGEGGMAETLAGSGIPAVVAMRFPVQDEGAKVFTTAFYTALANGRTVTESMAAGRLALFYMCQNQNFQNCEAHHEHLRKESSVSNSPNLQNGDSGDVPAEWFTPVLYLNQHIAEMVNVSRYDLPRDFYTRGQFVKEAHTRLIGAGFIGRKRQRMLMRRAFRERQVVCLVGLGGMGKTTLAEAFARNYDNHGIIIWRGEHEITELGILNRIVEEFWVWQPTSPLLGRLKGIVENAEMPILNRLGYLLRNCLAEEKVILIFDNFEDLQWQEGDAEARTIVDDGVREMLNHLLAHAPEHCRVLFTTRYRIEGLAGNVDFLDLDKLSLAEQYRLMNFSEVLRRIPSADRERIYARLDGLPRAFTFLEALVRNEAGFSFGDLEAQLGQVEADVFADLMLGRIYGLLSPELQQVFLVASVFFTRTPVGALAAVTGDQEVLAKLEMLRDWGLCFLDLDKGEFEVHAITRAWVELEGLLVEEERKRVALGAGEWFYGCPNLTCWELAISFFSVASEWDLYAKVAIRLQYLYNQQSQHAKAINLASVVLENVQDIELRSIAEGNMGASYFSLGDYEIAYRLLTKRLEYCRSSENFDGEITVLNNLAQIYLIIGRREKAQNYLQSALEMLNSHGNRTQTAAVHRDIGRILMAEGKIPEAIAKFNESLTLLENELDSPGAMSTINCLGLAYMEIDQYDEAEKCFHRALDLRGIVSGKGLEAASINNLALCYENTNRFELSEKYYREGLILAEDIGDKKGIGRVLTNLSILYSEMDREDEALHLLERSLEIQQSITDVEGLGLTLTRMVKILFEQERHESSIFYLFLAYNLFLNTDRDKISEIQPYLDLVYQEFGADRISKIISGQEQFDLKSTTT